MHDDDHSVFDDSNKKKRKPTSKNKVSSPDRKTTISFETIDVMNELNYLRIRRGET